jgi:hypothetical protein
MTDLEKDEPSGLPCEREWDGSPWLKDGGAWWCINDHTGCIYNDGQNTCYCEGNHPRPLETDEGILGMPLRALLKDYHLV